MSLKLWVLQVLSTQIAWVSAYTFGILSVINLQGLELLTVHRHNYVPYKYLPIKDNRRCYSDTYYLMVLVRPLPLRILISPWSGWAAHCLVLCFRTWDLSQFTTKVVFFFFPSLSYLVNSAWNLRIKPCSLHFLGSITIQGPCCLCKWSRSSCQLLPD